jgi:hypothetical protein
MAEEIDKIKANHYDDAIKALENEGEQVGEDQISVSMEALSEVLTHVGELRSEVIDNQDVMVKARVCILEMAERRETQNQTVQAVADELKKIASDLADRNNENPCNKGQSKAHSMFPWALAESLESTLA